MLAHELTHVVQQSADAGARGLSSSAPSVAMRKKNDSAAAVDPVDVALKGDDDDVRPHQTQGLGVQDHSSG
ncbi:MAG: hypothetical protein R2854_22555 [Caldilineaceae bacterium]